MIVTLGREKRYGRMGLVGVFLPVCLYQWTIIFIFEDFRSVYFKLLSYNRWFLIQKKDTEQGMVWDPILTYMKDHMGLVHGYVSISLFYSFYPSFTSVDCSYLSLPSRYLLLLPY